MPRKQIFGSVLILIILSFICMFIYDQFKDVKETKQTTLIEEVSEENPKLTLYYTDKNGRNYYLYGLDKITVDYSDHALELNKALEARQFSIEEIITYIGRKHEENYWDGGSFKIHNDQISLLSCNTIDRNQDYYFGPSNMEYKEGFCQEDPYICSFIKTYFVLDISPSKDSNFVYLTLKEYRGEEVVTVKVDSSLVGEIEEDHYYQFQFHSLGDSDLEDIESIFKYHKLDSITETEQIEDNQVHENICQ